MIIEEEGSRFFFSPTKEMKERPGAITLPFELLVIKASLNDFIIINRLETEMKGGKQVSTI